MASHDRPGQGAKAFRAFLRSLPDELARYGPFKIVFPTEPLEHQRRLLQVMGVTIVVEAGAAPHARRASGHLVPRPNE